MDAGPRYKNPALVVVAAGAERAIRMLHREGLLDPSRKIQGDAEIVIPVRADPSLLEWAQRLGARLVEAPDLPARRERVSPHEQVLERLAPTLAPRLLALVPEKWEKHGDVLVVRLPQELRPHAREVAQAYAQALDVRTVLNDVAGVSGELRTMAAEFLLGEDAEATHVENGIRYRFDASRIMFSSGNVEERRRIARVPAQGESVVDMFAGIGYFALPLAVHARPREVWALEKNPLSFRYLQENARLNHVEDVVKPWLGDNREFPHEALADRVHMGYFPHTQRFLPKAMRLLKREGGILHYHNTAHAEVWAEEMTKQVFDAAMDDHRGAQVTSARVVKSHSPGVVHAVLDVLVGPRA